MAEEQKELTALVIDDEEIVRDLLVACLEDNSVKVNSVETTREGLELLAQGNYYNLVITDLRQEPTGVEVYKTATSKAMLAYIITGGATNELMDEAKEVAGNNLIKKPFMSSEIDKMVEQARQYKPQS